MEPLPSVLLSGTSCSRPRARIMTLLRSILYYYSSSGLMVRARGRGHDVPKKSIVNSVMTRARACAHDELHYNGERFNAHRTARGSIHNYHRIAVFYSSLSTLGRVQSQCSIYTRTGAQAVASQTSTGIPRGNLLSGLCMYLQHSIH